MADIKSGEEVMEHLFALLRKAAANAGRPVGDDCTEKFKCKNIKGFEARFKLGHWPTEQPKLEVIASLHGAASAYVSFLKEPEATQVSLPVFEEVGALIRAQYCPPSKRTTKAGQRGDWCAWP